MTEKLNPNYSPIIHSILEAYMAMYSGPSKKVVPPDLGTASTLLYKPTADLFQACREQEPNGEILATAHRLGAEVFAFIVGMFENHDLLENRVAYNADHFFYLFPDEEIGKDAYKLMEGIYPITPLEIQLLTMIVKQRKLLESVMLSIAVHPDNEKDSEFADFVETIAEALEEKPIIIHKSK